MGTISDLGSLSTNDLTVQAEPAGPTVRVINEHGSKWGTSSR